MHAHTHTENYITKAHNHQNNLIVEQSIYIKLHTSTVLYKITL